MTSSKASKPKNDKETLRKLLHDRIAQLESREEDPPRSKDEQDAEDEFQVAWTAARALVDDKDIVPDEKMRVLQLMFTDCVKNVRALEYDLGLEEKRLSVAELDYSELGEDLRKIETSTEKLKSQSRELSKQNKAKLEASERRTTDLAGKLEQDYEKLQQEYEDRERYYEDTLNKACKEEEQQTRQFDEETKKYQHDETFITNARKRVGELKKQSIFIRADVEKIKEWHNEVTSRVKERQHALNRQQTDMKKLEQTEKNARKVMEKCEDETEELRARSKETIAIVKVGEEELEFWKTKSKSEFEKRETLERLCRTLTEERTIMRKEVQAMQAAWGMLENEIENLRMEINEPDS